MGAYLSQPVTTKESSSGAGAKHTWGCSSMQGWRNNMEDAHITMSDLGGDYAGLSFFGVFDGHGGKEVALFCREHFPDEVRRQLGQHGGGSSESWGGALRATFHAVDEQLRQPEQGRVLLALKQGRDLSSTDDGGPEEESPAPRAEGKTPQVLNHLQDSIQTDLEKARDKGSLTKEEAKQVIMKMALLKKMEGRDAPDSSSVAPGDGTAADNVGCTAVCILLTPSEVVCANAGDSRAILCRGGRPVELSHDHKPNEETERRRIEAAGGRVEEITVGERTIHRVNGNLSLSRAMGDHRDKKRYDLGPECQVVSATPDIISMPLVDEDEFIVLACDGIWDVKSNEEVCDFVRAGLRQGTRIPDLVEQLMDGCICPDPKESRGLGGDNMTCIIVQLQRGAC
mmetsp:Transcript_100750/g.260303  ORF Transcript_100750/g.260303 Transcript_100750/m.260303 type:complete len:398 (-) Transcript_100750:77-1270(-)